MIDVEHVGEIVLESDGSALRWRGDPDPSMAERMEDTMRKERIPEGEGKDDNGAVEILTAIFRERAYTVQGNIDADRFLEECKKILGKEEVALLRGQLCKVLRDYDTAEVRSVDRTLAQDEAETRSVDPILANDD